MRLGNRPRPLREMSETVSDVAVSTAADAEWTMAQVRSAAETVELAALVIAGCALAAFFLMLATGTRP